MTSRSAMWYDLEMASWMLDGFADMLANPTEDAESEDRGSRELSERIRRHTQRWRERYGLRHYKGVVLETIDVQPRVARRALSRP
jgi:hypothetical protein